MPFPRPTLTVLRTQAMQDITASDLPNADGFLRRAVLRVLAWVQAGFAHLHYGYLDWIAQQATPFTATDEFLEAWAALAPTPVLRVGPQPAACQSASFSGIAGKKIPALTLAQRNDGVSYQVIADAFVVGSVAVASIRAVVPGSAGNADVGTPLSLATAIDGINGVGSATATIAGGTDIETDASLRSRMLESYAAPPSGGDAADYVTWALGVPSVTRAWTRRNGMGTGTVVVYFMMDVAEAAHSGFPQGTNGVSSLETRDTAATGDHLVLADHLYPLEPVTALVYAVAPAAVPVNFTITGVSGATAGQKAAISGAIASLFVAKGSPLADTSIEQSDVTGAISSISGLPAFAITVPSSWPITPPIGSLFTVGTVSTP